MNGLRLLFALVASLVLANGAAAQAAPASKVYELRVYTAAEGKMPALLSRFRDHTLRLFEKHGMENVVYWTATEAPQGVSAENTLVYILAHRDREAARRSWAAFLADPEWRDAAAKSEANGPLLAGAPASVFMSSTDFDPGFWAPNRNGPAVAPLYELRLYRGGTALAPTVQRFREWERPIFTKHGMPTLGFWTANDSSAFVYFIGHRDRESARANWEKFFVDFRAEQAARRPAGAAAPPAAPATSAPATPPPAPAPGTVKLGNYFLVPTDFSPRK